MEAGRDRASSADRRGRRSPSSAGCPTRAGRSRVDRSRFAPSASSSAPGTRASRSRASGSIQPWTGSMDEGWTRWVLEQYGFAFVTLHPEDFTRRSATRSTSLIWPTMRGCRSQGAAGERRWTRRRRARLAPSEYADQLSPADLQRLRAVRPRRRHRRLPEQREQRSRFSSSSSRCRNVVAGLRPEDFFLRGSIVEVTTDPSQPVMAGMPEKAAVFADSSPVFETLDGFKGTVLARYQDVRLAAAVGLSDRREAPERQGGGARRAARRRPRHAARLPSGVARPAVRHVQGAVQRGACSADSRRYVARV